MQPSDAVLLTSATLPAPAAMAIGVASVTSGAGNGVQTAAVDASWISRYWPGAIETAGRSVCCAAFVLKLPAPVALAYWIDQPAMLAEDVPRLKSSMKSCVCVAPELPPPP